MIFLRIYRMLSEEDWHAHQFQKIYIPDELERDGFIHFSFKNQLVGVANAVYKNEDKLIVLEIDTDKLEHPDTLKIEDLYGYGEDYPHLYSGLNLSAVVSQFEMRNSELGFEMVE